MKKILTGFQLGSFKKRFPINGERITNANSEVEAEGSQAGHRKGKGTKDRNWKEEDTELLVTLYENRACLRDVAQKLNKQGQERRSLLSNPFTDQCQRNKLS